jgi:hypothetical protein
VTRTIHVLLASDARRALMLAELAEYARLSIEPSGVSVASAVIAWARLIASSARWKIAFPSAGAAAAFDSCAKATGDNTVPAEAATINPTSNERDIVFKRKLLQ